MGVHTEATPSPFMYICTHMHGYTPAHTCIHTPHTYTLVHIHKIYTYTRKEKQPQLNKFKLNKIKKYSPNLHQSVLVTVPVSMHAVARATAFKSNTKFEELFSFANGCFEGPVCVPEYACICAL